MQENAFLQIRIAKEAANYALIYRRARSQFKEHAIARHSGNIGLKRHIVCFA